MAVDLVHGLGGAPGEGDRLASIENASGGAGGDRFRGDDQANSFEGLGGNDVIDGAGGPDALYAGRGDDLLRGGTGDDRLDSGGRYGPYEGGLLGRDRLLCGRGSDGVDHAEPQTYLSAGCERVSTAEENLLFGDVQLRLPLRTLRSPSVAIEGVLCAVLRCRTSMSFRLVHPVGKLPAGALVGRRTIRLRADGQRGCVRGVRFTTGGRRLLRARRRALVKFTIRQDFPGGGRPQGGFLTTLVLGRGRSPDPPPSRFVRCFGTQDGSG